MSVFAEEKDDDGPTTHRRGNRVRAGFPVGGFEDDFDGDGSDSDGGHPKSKGTLADGGEDEVETLKIQLAAMAARNKALSDELRRSRQS